MEGSGITTEGIIGLLAFIGVCFLFVAFIKWRTKDSRNEEISKLITGLKASMYLDRDKPLKDRKDSWYWYKSELRRMWIDEPVLDTLYEQYVVNPPTVDPIFGDTKTKESNKS